MGHGKYYRVRVRSPSSFKKGSFRTHDMGRAGHSKRIAGKLKRSGRWATQAYLLSKQDFTVRNGRLTPATATAKRWYANFLKRYTRPTRKGKDWQTRPRKR